MKNIILILIVAALFALLWFGGELFRRFGALFRGFSARRSRPPEEFVFSTSESSMEEIAEAVARLKEQYGSDSVTVRIDGVSIPFDEIDGTDVERAP